ncbi:MAG: rod shape-determining protein MreC [Candidatus Dojkabacteria bacterium]|nr:MAG: rod shape-determining protein MreC [Candidatus Dojkabacteria bacterium]
MSASKFPVYFISFLVMSIVFLLDSIGALQFVYNTRSFIADPLLFAGKQSSANTVTFFSQIGSLHTLYEENVSLRAEVLQLRQELSQKEDIKSFCALSEEYLKNSTLQGVSKKVDAQVIDNSFGDSTGTLLINKGSEDGIAIDQAVSSGNTYIGVVSRVFPHTAVVTSIYRQNSSQKVAIQNKKVVGLLQNQNGRLIIGDILVTENVAEGDRVVAFILEDKVTLPVATVTRMEEGIGGSTKQAIISPLIALDDLTFVTVIIE